MNCDMNIGSAGVNICPWIGGANSCSSNSAARFKAATFVLLRMFRICFESDLVSFLANIISVVQSLSITRFCLLVFVVKTIIIKMEKMHIMIKFKCEIIYSP